MTIIKKILLIEFLFAIFLFGGILGINTQKNYKKQELINTYIQLEDEQDKVDRLNQENQRLNSILNNYTIQERRIK